MTVALLVTCLVGCQRVCEPAAEEPCLSCGSYQTRGFERFGKRTCAADGKGWSACVASGAALVAAAEAGDVSRVARLLDDGLDVDARGADCASGLSAAAGAGQGAVVDLLLARGADPLAHGLLVDGTAGAETPLLVAVEAGHLEVVKRFVGKKVDLNQGDLNGVSPLHRAVQLGRTPMVALLLAGGADPNQREQIGKRAPLDSAILDGRVEVMKLLLRHGADLHAEDNWGQTALHVAASAGQARMIAPLVAAGAKVDLGPPQEPSPLILAIQSSAETASISATIKALIAVGADVNLQAERGPLISESPMHAAARACRPEWVALLLAAGAKPNLEGDDQKRPLDRAACSRRAQRRCVPCDEAIMQKLTSMGLRPAKADQSGSPR